MFFNFKELNEFKSLKKLRSTGKAPSQRTSVLTAQALKKALERKRAAKCCCMETSLNTICNAYKETIKPFPTWPHDLFLTLNTAGLFNIVQRTEVDPDVQIH